VRHPGILQIKFNSPALLSLPEPENLPNGKVLALVELPGAAAAQAANRVRALSMPTNLKRIAQSKPQGGMTPAGGVPSDSQLPCSDDKEFAPTTSPEQTLVSRHVDCRIATSDNVDI
jgi:hypothetical protein